MPVAKADKLTLIHFNDVYNIERGDTDPCEPSISSYRLTIA